LFVYYHLNLQNNVLWLTLASNLII
jgi:hypothetical protein